MSALARSSALPAILAMMVASAGPALAMGGNANAVGNAGAILIRPITVSQTADLDFGTLASGGETTGAVTVAQAGTNYSGSAIAICGTGCVIPHPASFQVSGEANHSYAISAPTSLAIAGTSDSGGTAPTLTVNNLTIATTSRPGLGATGLLGPDGSDSFVVGGTLELPAALLPARYHASFPVIVTYN